MGISLCLAFTSTEEVVFLVRMLTTYGVAIMLSKLVPLKQVAEREDQP